MTVVGEVSVGLLIVAFFYFSWQRDISRRKIHRLLEQAAKPVANQAFEEEIVWGNDHFTVSQPDGSWCIYWLAVGYPQRVWSCRSKDTAIEMIKRLEKVTNPDTKAAEEVR